MKYDDVIISYDDSSPNTETLALVLIHGFAYNKKMWDEQRTLLSKNHRVITYDIRGHGKTTSGYKDYTMELLADDLKHLIDHLNLKNFILGGFSMGGYIALAFCRKYKTPFKKLILMNTKHTADSEETKENRQVLAQRVESNGVESVSSILINRMLTKETLKTHPEIKIRGQRMILEASAKGIASSSRAMGKRKDSTSVLSTITVPTLIIVGDEDRVTPVVFSEEMHSLIPNSVLEIIPNAGHLSNLDNPTAFTKALINFL